MRVLHVVYECVPGAYAGGVQKMVFELAQAQRRRGDEVEIWTIGERHRRDVAPGVCIRQFPGNARWRSVEMQRALAEEQGRFDVINAHNTFLCLNRYVAGVARKWGRRVFYHVHGALDAKLLRGWSLKALKKRLYIELFERRNYNAAAGVIGLTAIECSQIEQIRPRSAIFESPNGVEVQPAADSYSAAAFRLKQKIPVAHPVILFIGRITHKKGLHYLIEAFSHVLGEIGEAQLVICGERRQDIGYVRGLDCQIERLNLGAHVRWAGFLDEVGKRAAYASCSVFVHPSYSEGMALAILEAMAAGVPTVVTPGCYMSTAARAGALLESCQDSRSLAIAITEVLANPAKAARLGRAGADYVHHHHTWSVVADRLACIYEGGAEVSPYRPALA